MAETAEKKKKIYKLATELNLSHETLIQFLRKKGYQVKSHMTSVDGDMLREILAHFKKDKDVAEKHQRKIQEIRESRKRAERKPEEHIDPAPTVHVAQEEVITAKPVAEQTPPITEETAPTVAEPPIVPKR